MTIAANILVSLPKYKRKKNASFSEVHVGVEGVITYDDFDKPMVIANFVVSDKFYHMVAINLQRYSKIKGSYKRYSQQSLFTSKFLLRNVRLTRNLFDALSKSEELTKLYSGLGYVAGLG